MRKCIFILLFFNPIEIFSQCSGGANGGSITPTTSWQTTTVEAGKYYTFVVAAGTCDTYDFSFCQGGGSASFDTQLTTRTNADVYAGSYNDDNCSLQSEILGFAPSGAGTYRILVNNYNCASSGASATLAFRKSSPGSNANYIFLEDATATGNCINLTPASNDQKGCAWDVNSTLDFSSNFSFDFTVNLGSNDAGADGMAFVMHNDPAGLCACGASGGSLGAGGITNSLIVEIDTYLNTEDRDDGMSGVLCSGGSEPDHIDIWLNGNINPFADCSYQPPGARVVTSAVPLMNGASLYNIENGANHILRIAWNSGSSTLTASVWNATVSTCYGTITYSFNPISVFGTNSPYFGFTASTGGLSNSQSYCLPNILLPVELVSFEGECFEGKTRITWSSSTETDNDFYFLEKSLDGFNFQTVYVVNGSLSSNHVLNYQFIDNSNDGLAYYRLSQTNINGVTKIIGSTIEVNCFNNVDIAIFPNPAQEQVTFDFGNNELQGVTVCFYDLSGKKVFEKSFDKAASLKNMDISTLSNGVYFVTVESTKNIVFQDKLVITK